MSIIMENFKRYTINTIVRNVPANIFWKEEEEDVFRYKMVDVIVEEDRGIGYMPSDDNMEFFNRNYPYYKRVMYSTKNILRGEIL